MQRPPAHLTPPPTDVWSEANVTPAADVGADERRLLKAQLHQQLVTSMDMSVLVSMGQDRLRTEVGRMAEELCQRSAQLLSRPERDRIVGEVLDETFGLGPLEALM